MGGDLVKRRRGQWVPHDGATQIKPPLQGGNPTQSGEILRTALRPHQSSDYWAIERGT